MSRLILDINDSGILGSLLPDGGLEHLGAGYALREGNALFLGEAARARSRSRPRGLHSRFWQNFGDPSDQSLGTENGKSSNLVHQQLSQIWGRFKGKATEVTMALPSCFNQRQLGLLRGMAQTMEMPLTCMVDSALAAALPVLASNRHGNVEQGQRILFADLHLHRVTWAGLQCRAIEGTHDPWLVHETWGQVSKVGLVRLTHLWARFLSDAFVRTTRFDPFFNGSTEQALYDHIPSWLRDIGKCGKATVSLHGPGNPNHLETTASEWIAAVEPTYRQILDSLKQVLNQWQPALLLLSHRLASLPGLAENMASSFAGTTLSPPGDGILKGIQAMGDLDQRTGASFQLVIQQPIPENDSESFHEAKLVSASSAAEQPTHVLMEAMAYPLNQQKFTLTNGELVNGSGIALPQGSSALHFELQKDAKGLVLKTIAGRCTVNGKEVEESTYLAIGDRISLTGTQIEIQLIREAT